MSAARILIIDDDDLLSEMLKLTLELEGFEAHTAPHGLAGMEQVRASRFDLIILDLVMPKMDGVKFLRVLNDSDLHRPPILIISASADNVLDNAHRALGVVGISRKPLEPAKLVANVKAALAGVE